MGVVWRAQDRVLGRQVAVKEVVFPPTMAEAERRPARARVMREARAAARLNHPGAVTLYDVVSDQGGIFIVMELVEAATLADLVQAQGPLAPERVAELGRQLVGVLEAAHGVGIVHRDVKPGNVMVAADGGVKLADFGVAWLQGDPQLTSTGLVLGSPAYMAPEQARGEVGGPATDFWGLGATLFYGVEGEPPFDRGSSIATLAAVVNERPPVPGRAGALAPLIGALLAKDPTARPSGPKVRAWLDWLLIVGLSAQPAENIRTRRPGDTGPVAPPQSSAESTAAPAPPVPGRAGRRLLGVVSLLLLGGILVAWLTGVLPAGGSEDRAAPPTTRADAAVSPGQEQAAPASTRPAPSTTRTPPTTRAPTTSAAVRGGLPAGWRAFTNRAGNDRVGVPPGFRVHTRRRYHAAVVEEQGGARRVFTVRSQTPSALLPQASRDYRAWARRNLTGFREVRYAEDQTYAGRPGAVVFEYQAVRDGRRVHVRHVNVKGRRWGYNVEFIAPAGDWDASRTLARQFEQAFQPLG
jgi:eukaryotic-like serine/threonine-protein kinase